jgi:sugar phosphate permease
MSFFLTSAFQITMTIQLFNWFSKRILGTVLGFWLAAQSLGLITKFVILGIWSYFPNFYNAED